MKPKMLSAMLVSFVALGGAAFAGGVEFLPYRPLSQEARDHEHELKFYSTQIPDALRPVLQSFRMDDDLELVMFSEVFDAMETLHNRQGLKESPAGVEFCDRMQLDNILNSAGDCSDPAMTSAKENLQKFCSRLEKPELLSLDVKIEDVDVKKILSLREQTLALLAPFAQLGGAEGLVEPSDVPFLRSALRKILTDDLNALQLRTEANIKTLESSVACLNLSYRVITKMRNVLSAAATQRVEEYQAGHEAQKKQIVEKRKAGRCLQLPGIPALTDDELSLFSMYYGGLTWRARGAGIWAKTGTQQARKTWAGASLRNLVELNGARKGDDFGDAMVRRLQLKGWGQWFDMGTEHDTKYFDLGKMTQRGKYQMGGSSPYLPIFSGASPMEALGEQNYQLGFLRAAGLHMGPCYYYGIYNSDVLGKNYNLPIGENWQKFSAKLNPFLHSFGSSAGELCQGAAIGLALSKTIRAGAVCD